MSYEYDVFISYKQGVHFGEWVIEYFFDLFNAFLGEALQKEARVFVDKKNISPGNSLTPDVKHALAKSICMVGIWSPRYFGSDWCKWECSMMLHRERTLGYRTNENPSGLIIPIIAHDGKSFPEAVKDIKKTDFTDCVRTGPGFKKCERYVEFQDRLILFADDVARVVKAPPQWDEKWLTEKWMSGGLGVFDEMRHHDTFPKPAL